LCRDWIGESVLKNVDSQAEKEDRQKTSKAAKGAPQTASNYQGPGMMPPRMVMPGSAAHGSTLVGTAAVRGRLLETKKV
jgi:hypothetical protein